MSNKYSPGCGCCGDDCDIFDGDIADTNWSTSGGTFNSPGITLPDGTATATLDTLLDANSSVLVSLTGAGVTGTARGSTLPSAFNCKIEIGSTLFAEFTAVPDGLGETTYTIDLSDGSSYLATTVDPLNDFDIALSVSEIDNNGVTEYCVNAELNAFTLAAYYETAPVVQDDQVVVSPISVSITIDSALIRYGTSTAKPACAAITCDPPCDTLDDDGNLLKGASLVITGFPASIYEHRRINTFIGGNPAYRDEIIEYSGMDAANGTHSFFARNENGFCVMTGTVGFTVPRVYSQRTFLTTTDPPPAYTVESEDYILLVDSRGIVTLLAASSVGGTGGVNNFPTTFQANMDLTRLSQGTSLFACTTVASLYDANNNAVSGPNAVRAVWTLFGAPSGGSCNLDDNVDGAQVTCSFIT